jgi:hypothetical protein
MNGFSTFLLFVLAATAHAAVVDNVDESLPSNLTFQITARFNRLSLDEFLKKKPKLWKVCFRKLMIFTFVFQSKPVTKDQLSYYKSTMGSLSAHPAELKMVSRFSRNKSGRQLKQALPRHFDAREKWPNCRSISTILVSLYESF